MKKLSEIIENYYLDYVNNYLTIEKFAEDNEISKDFASLLVEAGRKINQNK